MRKPFLVHLAILGTVGSLAFLWFRSMFGAEGGWGVLGALILLAQFGGLLPLYLAVTTALMFGFGTLIRKSTPRLVLLGVAVHSLSVLGLVGFAWYRLQAPPPPDEVVHAEYTDRRSSTRRIAGIRRFPNLRGLTIHNRELSDDDRAAIAEATTLEYLQISQSGLTDISFISPLHNLTHLTLSSNQIRDLRPLGALDKLTELSVSNNRIDDVTVLGALPVLERVDLFRNRVRDVGAVLDAKVSVSDNVLPDRIALGGNPVTDLSALRNYRRATYADVSGNRAGDSGLRVFRGFDRLTELNLSDSGLTTLRHLPELPRLTTLDLSGNRLRDVRALVRFPSLTTVRLFGNDRPLDLEPFLRLKRLESLGFSSLCIRGGDEAFYDAFETRLRATRELYVNINLSQSEACPL